VKLTARTKLVLLALLFAAPIVASSLAYLVARPEATSNYGELLLPPVQAPAHAFERTGAKPFTFAELGGKWVMVAFDAGTCASACRDKLAAMRQVRLALGRRAPRVARVFIAEGSIDTQALAAEFDGMIIAQRGSHAPLPTGFGRDPAHIYLVDPRGNVMMRWPAAPDPKRMLRDLDRLLRASQIG
jgi:cytochrome oxidase Cu insertion factor (SCO1/SenC/PrrC family)